MSGIPVSDVSDEGCQRAVLRTSDNSKLSRGSLVLVRRAAEAAGLSTVMIRQLISTGNNITETCGQTPNINNDVYSSGCQHSLTH
jgi:hypothetical protein